MVRQGCRLMRVEATFSPRESRPLRAYTLLQATFVLLFLFLRLATGSPAPLTFHLKLITLIYGTVNLGAAAAAAGAR